jgi:DNA replication protein DnaC
MKNSSSSLSIEPAVEALNQADEEICSICGGPNVCGGTGFWRRDVPVDHPDFGKLIPCEGRAKQLRAKRLTELRRVSNMDALAHYTFDNFMPQGMGFQKDRSLANAYEAAQDFAKKPDGWLVLIGGYGCGKTHLAAAVANACIQQGQSALFVVVPDLLDHLRATYSPYSTSTYDERFQEIRSAPLLILDDLGTQATTPWAQEKLFQIFNHRYNARLPTVITSNHTLEELDKRIRSRLGELPFSRIFTILAPDFRQGLESSELSTLTYHQDKIFDTFDLRTEELDREKAANLRHAFNLAQKYAHTPQNWILFTGTYGCGKTHLAAAIANERVKQDEPAFFIVVPDLLDHLRAAFSPAALTPYDKRFEEVRNTPLLILDDLGTHSATPWAEEKLYQLFNHRYNARLPTIITMVDTTELNPRLKSRLLDVDRCTPIAITAPSYRGVSALNKKQTAPLRRPRPSSSTGFKRRR